MKVQNYQNNQPSFKMNALITNDAVQHLAGKVPDIYAVVAKAARNGAEPDQIVRVSQGYIAPDASHYLGANLIAELKELRSMPQSAKSFSEQASHIDVLASFIATKPSKVVVIDRLA